MSTQETEQAQHAELHYWTKPNLEDARRVIANCENWGLRAVIDLRHFLTPTVVNAIWRTISEMTALEIGCGVGRLVLPMAMVFGKVIGVDSTPRMIELSQKYLGSYQWVLPDVVQHCEMLAGDGMTLPVADKSVGFVYSMIALQHLPFVENIRSYLRETRRVLQPGGLTRMQMYRCSSPPHHVDWRELFPDANAFAAEFERVGLKVLEAEHDQYFPDWLWVTAQR